MKKILKIVLCFVFLMIFALPSFAEGETRWRKNMILIAIPEHEYYSAMNNSFKKWENQLKQKLQFYNTKAMKASSVKENQNLADIAVVFRSVSGENAKNSGSVSLQVAGSGAIRRAEITIILKDDPNLLTDPKAKAENDREIKTIMLQQVGKSLGLKASSDPKSVMYERKSEDEKLEAQDITPEDIEKLFVLYHWPQYRPLKK